MSDILPAPTGKCTFSTSATSVRSSLRSSYARINKPELIKLVNPMRKMLKGVEMNYVPNNAPSLLPGYIDTFVKQGANLMNKAQIEELAVGLSENLENVKAMAEAADPRYIEVWRRLLGTVFVPLPEIAKILGHIPPVEKCPIWGYSHIVATEPMLMLSSIITPSSFGSFSEEERMKILFTLPNSLRKQAAELFFDGDPLKPVVTEFLPSEEATLRVEDYQKEMVREINLLMAVASSGKISITTTSISQQKIKSLDSKVNFAPFVTGEKEPSPLKRAEVMASAYFFYYLSRNAKDRMLASGDFGEFAKFIVGKRFPDFMSTSFFKIFLPKLEGFSKSWSSYSLADKILENVNRLIEPAKDGWLDLSNFQLRYLCADTVYATYQPFTNLFNREPRWGTFERKSELGINPYYRTPINWWNDVTREFILNYLRMLCAAGLLEIAYDAQIDPDSAPEDALQGMRFIRLTSLGKYALHLDSSYSLDCEVDKKEYTYDCDPDNLILTVSSPDSPYIPFLKDIGEQISAIRFKITPQTINSRAFDRNTVENRLGIFKSIICPEPQGIWAEMIEETRRCAAISRPLPERYDIISLDLTIPGLLNFINTNDEILSHCLRAEQSILLVPHTFRDRLQSLLHTAGYLL